MRANSWHRNSEDIQCIQAPVPAAGLSRFREHHEPLECWSMSPRTDGLQHTGRNQGKPLAAGGKKKSLNSASKKQGVENCFFSLPTYTRL